MSGDSNVNFRPSADSNVTSARLDRHQNYDVWVWNTRAYALDGARFALLGMPPDASGSGTAAYHPILYSHPFVTPGRYKRNSKKEEEKVDSFGSHRPSMYKKRERPAPHVRGWIVRMHAFCARAAAQPLALKQ